MPQPLKLKKLKLNGSMRTNETFQNEHQKKMSLSSQGTGMQKQEVKTYLKQQASLAGPRLTVLPTERTVHSKHPFPTARDDSTHGHHQMVNNEVRLIIFFAAKDGEALYRQQKQDKGTVAFMICGSDHEILIAKFRLKLKKVGKTTRPFR